MYQYGFYPSTIGREKVSYSRNKVASDENLGGKYEVEDSINAGEYVYSWKNRLGADGDLGILGYSMLKNA